VQLFERFHSDPLTQASLFCAGAMFCLPFVLAYHHIPVASFYNEWVAAFCGVMAAFSLSSASFWQAPRLPVSSLIFLFLLILTHVQVVFGKSPSVSSLPLIQSYLMWAFLVCVLGQHLRLAVGWKTLTSTLAWALVSAGAVNAFFVGLQIVQQFGLKFGITLPNYGMLGQNNNFADLTALAVISLLYLRLTVQISLGALYVGLALGLVMFTLSGSRSSVLYLVAIAFWSWQLLIKTRNRQAPALATRQLLYISLGLLPAFIAIQLIVATYFPQALTHTPMARAAEQLTSNPQSLRWQFWQTSLYLFKQSPLMGVGMGQMRWQTFLLVNDAQANPAHLFFEHAHNIVFNLLAELGLIAPLIVCLGVLFCFISFLRKQGLQPEGWWVMSAMTTIGIHSMLEYPLWYAFFLGITAFLMGAADVHTLSLTSSSPGLKKWLRIFVLCIGLYGLQQLTVMWIGYAKLEKQIAVATQPVMTITQKQKLVEEMLWVDQHTLLAPCAELVLATFLTPVSSQAADQLPIVENAVRFMPLRRPLLNLIILLDMNHRHAEALQHLRSLHRIIGIDIQLEILKMPAEHIPRLISLLQATEATPPVQSK
jgi:O-antigen ligase